ncbi:GHMP kinase [Metallosphaera tengchongensis]|uniref:phosphomevalonate kinase n=1 Tax=Metallosphaera tengchongensis TaxID=1532350 RepID=A0A6N0NTK5_9CREN|nr:phosphomevalonate kinase [Metallosphaera tengchongensis]QKQ99242.1 GHMP kinase [Metallosphaera tengchongensis]
MKVSAPGKVLWIGSYSVVFGGISHVIAIDKRVTCECAKAQEMEFVTTFGKFSEGQNELIDSVLETLRTSYDLPKMKVVLTNDDAFQIDGKKTGLGSSSAATVALMGCVLGLINNSLDKDLVYRLSQKANYVRQRGIGSGFDIAAAVYGSVVYRRYRDINRVDSQLEPLRLPRRVKMLLGFTGRSANTVNLVKKFEEAKDNAEFKEIIHEIELNNDMAIRLLKLGKIEAAIPHVRLSRNLLNLLSEGVVGVKLETEEDRRIMGLAERNGAIISLMPGAGGGDLILSLGYELENVKRAWMKEGIKVIEVNEDEGLRLEN